MAALGGALAGGSLAGALNGTIIGSTVGLIEGATNGIRQADAAAEQRAKEQISNLSLKADNIPPNGTSSGYIFYPTGEYQKIQAVFGFTESNTTETVISQLR